MLRIAEPFPAWAWPLAWAWLENARNQVLDDFSPQTADEFVEYSGRAYARTFGIWKDESLAGAVGIERNSPAVVTAHILLSRRAFGLPAAELRAIAAALFDSEPALVRIQAFVPAWNRLAIALCRRLGGTVEGTMRAAAMRGGKPADAVVVGITREDFNGFEPGRIDGRVGQQIDRDVERNSVEPVLAGSGRDTGHAGEPVPESDPLNDVWTALAGDGGGDNVERGPDQQGLRDRGRQPAKQTRGARNGGLGKKRRRDSANGAGKTGSAGGKPRGGRRKPASAK